MTSVTHNRTATGKLVIHRSTFFFVLVIQILLIAMNCAGDLQHPDSDKSQPIIAHFGWPMHFGSQSGREFRHSLPLRSDFELWRIDEINEANLSPLIVNGLACVVISLAIGAGWEWRRRRRKRLFHFTRKELVIMSFALFFGVWFGRDFYVSKLSIMRLRNHVSPQIRVGYDGKEILGRTRAAFAPLAFLLDKPGPAASASKVKLSHATGLTIGGMPNPKSKTFSYVASSAIDIITDMPDLQFLELSGTAHLQQSDIPKLVLLPNLQRLSLNEATAEELSSLPPMQSLKQLELFNPHTDKGYLQAIAEQPTVTSLHIESDQTLPPATGLDDLQQLESLTLKIACEPEVGAEIGSLAKLRDLTLIFASEFPNATTFSWEALSNLTKLRDLTIHRIRGTDGLIFSVNQSAAKAIASIPGLQKLHICGLFEECDLRRIFENPTLTYVFIEDLRMNDGSLEMLSELRGDRNFALIVSRTESMTDSALNKFYSAQTQRPIIPQDR